MKVTIEVPNAIAQEFNKVAIEKGYKNGLHFLRELIRGQLFEARVAKRNAAGEIAAELEALLPSEQLDV